MKQGRDRGLLFGAVFTALFGSFLASSGLVLCLGADGHRALELEHGTTGCPTLAAGPNTEAMTVQVPAECLDLSVAGTALKTSSTADDERTFTAPLAFVAVAVEPVRPVLGRTPTPNEARDGPPNVALHLASTVLLV